MSTSDRSRALHNYLVNITEVFEGMFHPDSTHVWDPNVIAEVEVFAKRMTAAATNAKTQETP